jgi:hypothetical protein
MFFGDIFLNGFLLYYLVFITLYGTAVHGNIPINYVGNFYPLIKVFRNNIRLLDPDTLSKS